jgi:hypothetical protein
MQNLSPADSTLLRACFMETPMLFKGVTTTARDTAAVYTLRVWDVDLYMECTSDCAV